MEHFIPCLCFGVKCVAILLTNIVGNFIGAICKHPEEDPVSTADCFPSFVHPCCYEHTTTANSLHENVTRNRQVLPVIQDHSTHALNFTHHSELVCKVVLSLGAVLSPLIVSYDADGLVSICHPRDGSLSHNLS